MALTNFYEILEAIIGSPINDYQAFVLYTLACVFGGFIILFVFQMFILITNIFKPSQK